jgi:drug/metabolite transporter (DMT)-like permease
MSSGGSDVERPGRAGVIGGALVAASSLLFGIVVILGRITADSGLPVAAVLAVRFAGCALLLAAVLVATRRPLVAVEGERAGAVFAGVGGYAVEASFFFAALRHGNAAPVTLLFYTYPVFVTLASWPLGRGAPSAPTIVALALGIGGAGLVVAGSGQLAIATLGVILALCSAVTYTGYILAADRVLRRTQPLTSSLWVSGAACVGLAAFALVTGSLALPTRAADWLAILGMSVATAAAFVCLFAGLQRLGAVRTAIISSTEPLAAALLAVAFLGESVGLSVAIGGVLIVAGAVVASIGVGAAPPEPPIP